MKERLQKILAANGICSRRKAEEYLKQGRVKVNGVTASIGDSADIEKDIVTFDGREAGDRVKNIYIMLNKPKGYVTTMADEAGRPDVSGLVTGVPGRVYPVGRLDMPSEGMLLMTNDGQLSNKLTHPSHQVYKEYIARIACTQKPKFPPEVSLSKSMVIDGWRTVPAICKTLRQDGNQYLMSISIREGRNRQIRKMCALQGYEVISLKRVAVGELKLEDLKPGTWRYLTAAEVRYLKSI